ncbi:MAG: peptidoglycan bridge formation glycyltransferase FemA/FemB family protein, partial [Erysipelotrichales bacterium]|nr:peptidoglycan bridge formation glycyltransferase FemA/FemB family protein [Erysipelotrichales bacterium]
VYDRLTERKNKNPEKFKAQGQLDETIARLEAGNRKLEEYEALKEKYGDKALLSVNMDFFWGDREVVAVFGGNDPELFGLNGQYALYWEMIKEAKRRGCERFNFMGIPDDITENDPMWGVYQTKKAYHGRVEKLIGEFDYVIRPMVYKLYKAAVKAL